LARGTDEPCGPRKRPSGLVVSGRSHTIADHGVAGVLSVGLLYHLGNDGVKAILFEAIRGMRPGGFIALRCARPRSRRQAAGACDSIPGRRRIDAQLTEPAGAPRSRSAGIRTIHSQGERTRNVCSRMQEQSVLNRRGLHRARRRSRTDATMMRPAGRRVDGTAPVAPGSLPT
jgi:hypothetical protein